MLSILTFDSIKSIQNITDPPVNPTTPTKPINKPTTLIPPLRLIAALIVARLGCPAVVLAPPLIVVVCRLQFAVTMLVNVDFGSVLVLTVFVLRTTEVVAFGKQAVVDVRVRVEAEDVEIWLARVAIVVVRSEEVVNVRLEVEVVVESEPRVVIVVAVDEMEEMGVVVMMWLELELGLSVRPTRVIVTMVMSSALEFGDEVAVMGEAKTSVIAAIVPGVVKAATAMSGVTGFEYGVTSS